MGFDAAVMAGESRELSATVIELLPNAIYRVELETRKQVLAHAAGVRARNFVRIRPGDRVSIELAPHDPGRGRIVEILKD